MILIVSDLHLTDSQKDVYRFDLFPFLASKAKQYDVEAIFLLGDLTDLKDRHRAKLVNRIVDNLLMLSDICPVYMIPGNHDGFDPRLPFFQFLDDLEDIIYVTEPTLLEVLSKQFLLLPFTKEPEKWDRKMLKKADFILMHQTVAGVVASNSFILDGLDPSIFDGLKARVFSGDIHVPQKVGPVTYVGAPYSIRFNDTFKPRVLLVDENTKKGKNLRFKCLRKHTLKIKEPDDIFNIKELNEGDQVKVRLSLAKVDLVNWPNLRQQVIDNCKKKKLEMFSVELVIPENKKKDNTKRVQSGISAKLPKDIYLSYCKSERISPNLRKAGLGFLK